ncbi:transcription factor NF-E2 45 kDa subunit [Aplochiton taeniatus]
MCSSANYVLPLRRNCEISLDRLCGGVSMPTTSPAARSHGIAQDTDMDLAWQELMAITELQEFEVANEGPYEMMPYHPTDSTVPLGGFGTAQAPTEPLSIDPAYQRSSYSEGIPACQLLSTSADDQYGQSGCLLVPRMMPTAELPQPPLMSLEHMNMAGVTQAHRKDSMSLVQGSSIGMLGNLTGQNLQPHSAEDLESDSGLSLGSSPPLASPNDAAPNMLAYQSTEIHLNHVKQQEGLASALNEMHGNASGMASRGSFCPGLYSKPGDSASATAPLSRDERRALTLKIPFPIEKIINLPVDDFNELLTQYTLTDTQMALVRDIRRRGKNKVAAQNCRKRKLQNIAHLEGELGQLQAQRDHLARERLAFQNSLAYAKCRLTGLYREVFSHLRDEDGHPYSIEDYSLQQTPDGKIYLLPLQKGQDRD